MKNKSQVEPAAEPAPEEAYRRVALDLASERQDAGPIKLKIISNSMVPLLQPGDTVLVAPLMPGLILQRGDIIVFRRSDSDGPGVPLTHRLIGRSEAGWVTKGDHRLLPDASVTRQELLGKVIAVERSRRLVDINTPGWRFVNGLLGWFHFGIGSLMTAAIRIRKHLDF